MIAWLIVGLWPVHGNAAVSDLVARMPVQNQAELQSINAQLIQQGPDAVGEVCQMLVPAGQGNDAKARFAVQGLVMHANRPQAEADRHLVSTALLKALSTATDNEVKAFLLSQIQLLAHDEAIEPLSEFLLHKELADPAARVLVAVRSPAAGAALAKALPLAPEANRVTLIQALGELGYTNAAPELAFYATSNNPEARQAAWFALANLAVPPAGQILRQALESGSVYERFKAASFSLWYAQRLADTGRAPRSERVCRRLMATLSGPDYSQVRSGALSLLVRIKGAEALPDLLAALDETNLVFRARALQLAASVSGPSATREWVQKLPAVSPPVRAEIITMLGQRGDSSALPALRQAWQDAGKEARLAAISAAVRLGGIDVIPDLVQAFSAQQTEELKTLAEALKYLRGELIIATVGRCLSTAPAYVRPLLMGWLAQRRATTQAEPVLAQINDADSTVRLAALRALANVGRGQDLPQLVDALFTHPVAAEQTALQESIIAVGKRIPDAEKRAAAILSRLPAASGQDRMALLVCLSGLGGSSALRAVVAEVSSPDQVLRDAALRGLADWPDQTGVPELLKILQGNLEAKYQVLAMRGLLRLAEAEELSADQKVELCRQAIGAAVRPEEKKMVLAMLGETRTLPALRLAAASLKDPTLQKEAVLAVVKIACPADRNDPGLKGAEVRALLEPALPLAADNQVKSRIEAHLKTLGQ